MAYRWPYPVTRWDGHDDFTDFPQEAHGSLVSSFLLVQTIGVLEHQRTLGNGLRLFFLGGLPPLPKETMRNAEFTSDPTCFFTKIIMPWAHGAANLEGH